jgi:formamidopyrimidine-DNA glycosylase
VPELPEVEALCRFLDERLAGQLVDSVGVASVSALKTFEPAVTSLEGSRLGGVSRRGKLVVVRAAEPEELFVVLHLARGGWVSWRQQVPDRPVGPGRGPLALRFRLAGGSGFEVSEQGREKRLAVWVARSLGSLDVVANLGVDPLDPDLSQQRLGELLRSSSHHLKGALTDQRLLAGIGNAYSDEILHAARLSPFKPAARLSPAELDRLHQAVVGVLSEAVQGAAGLPASGLKAHKRFGLRVHGRAGQACPACGDVVRQVSFATSSLEYCPSCQTGGRVLADRRLSRLVK